MALYLYPRIYAIHNLTAEDCFANPETMQLVVPPLMRASFARVEEGGVYLVDNGQCVLLWLHAQVSPNLLEDLFGEGMSSLQELDPMLNELPVLETHLNAQVRNLIQYISSTRGSKAATIQLARQGSRRLRVRICSNAGRGSETTRLKAMLTGWCMCTGRFRWS